VQVRLPPEVGLLTNPHRCNSKQGFSLHAAVRQRLEQLWRYITQLALANERVQINGAGQVVLKLKTPSLDGTRHIVKSPLESMQRLAVLGPRPKLHCQMTASGA
jgi:hypothetical protein